VDRRLDRRYPLDLKVQVTDLTRQGFSGTARLTNISNSGVGLLLSEPLMPGDFVRLEIADTFLLGHVVHSRLDRDGFSAGVEIERVLIGGSDLSRLLHSVLAQNMPDIPGVRQR
jgi:hypothetical protein